MSNFTTTISVKYDFEPLNRTNWVTWVAQMQDWIEGQDAKGTKPIWDEYESTVKAAQAGDESGDDDDQAHEPHDYQAESQAKRTYHNQCWRYVRKHLSSNMFAKVQDFKPKSVPLLLLSLKDICCDGSDVERAVINDKYREMRASNYDNIDDYNTAFLAIVRVMTDLKMGDTLGPHSNSALAYQYERGLGPSYDHAKMIRQASDTEKSKPLEGIMAFYLKQAKARDLPGNPNKPRGTRESAHMVGHNLEFDQMDLSQIRELQQSVSKALRERVHLASLDELKADEICRKHLMGKCTNGDNCRYRHLPGGTKLQNGGAEKCAHCGKNGHPEARCWAKHPELKPGRANDRANVADEHGGAPPDSDGDRLEVDNHAYVATDTVTITVAHTASEGPQERSAHVSRFLQDSGATCGITTDARDCHHIQPCDITIKVGGGSVHCTQQGTMTAWHQLPNGKVARVDVPMRIVPGFGCKIMPDSFFQKRGCTVRKTGSDMTFRAPDGVIVGYAARTDSD